VVVELRHGVGRDCPEERDGLRAGEQEALLGLESVQIAI
jgi:hypothetical protein